MSELDQRLAEVSDQALRAELKRRRDEVRIPRKSVRIVAKKPIKPRGAKR